MTLQYEHELGGCNVSTRFPGCITFLAFEGYRATLKQGRTSHATTFKTEQLNRLFCILLPRWSLEVDASRKHDHPNPP